jgi:hypothetical protein
LGRRRLSRLLNTVSNERLSDEKPSASSQKVVRVARYKLGETIDSTPKKSKVTPRGSIPSHDDLMNSPFQSFRRRTKSLSPSRRQSIAKDYTDSRDISEMSVQPTKIVASESSKLDLGMLTSLTADMSKKVLTIDNCETVQEISSKFMDIKKDAASIGLRSLVLFLKDPQGKYESFDGQGSSKHLTPSFVSQYLLKEGSSMNQTTVFTPLDRGYEVLYDMLSSFEEMAPLSTETGDAIIIDYYYHPYDYLVESKNNNSNSNTNTAETVSKLSDVFQLVNPCFGFFVGIISQEFNIPFFPFSGFVNQNIRDVQDILKKVLFHSLGNSLYNQYNRCFDKDFHRQRINDIYQEMNKISNMQNEDKSGLESVIKEEKIKFQFMESILALDLFLSSSNSSATLSMYEASVAVLKTLTGITSTLCPLSATSAFNKPGAMNIKSWIIFLDYCANEEYYSLRIITNFLPPQSVIVNKRSVMKLFQIDEPTTSSVTSATSPKNNKSALPHLMDVTDHEQIQWLYTLVGGNSNERNRMMNDAYFDEITKLSVAKVMIPIISKDETIIPLAGNNLSCFIFTELIPSSPITTFEKGSLNIPSVKSNILKCLSEISIIVQINFKQLFITENSGLQSNAKELTNLLQDTLSFNSIDFNLLNNESETEEMGRTGSERNNKLDCFHSVNDQINARLLTAFSSTASVSSYSSILSLLKVRSTHLLFSKGLMQAFGFSYEENSYGNESGSASFTEFFEFQTHVRQFSKINSLVRSDYPWYKDLMGGKTVLFSPGKNRNILMSESAYSSKNLVDSRQGLIQFLDTIEHDILCSSSLLLPIQTNYGLAILVLMDQQNNFWKEFASLTSSPMSLGEIEVSQLFFTMQYAETLQSSKLTSLITHNINQSVELSGLIYRSVVSEVNFDRELNKNSFIYNQLLKQLQKKKLKFYFQTWKLQKDLCLQQKETDLKTKFNAFYIELIQFRSANKAFLNFPAPVTLHNASTLAQGSLTVNKLLETFLSTVETQFHKFFTNETIQIVPYKFEEDFVSPTSPLNKPHLHLLFQRIEFDSAFDYTKGDGRGTQSQHAVFEDFPPVLATVILSRPKSINNDFTAEEKELFEELCATITLVYSSLRTGFQIPPKIIPKEVEFKDLTIPMLDQLLPVILSITDSEKIDSISGINKKLKNDDVANSDTDETIYFMIQWIKKVLDAELVICKFNNIHGELSDSKSLLYSSDSKGYDHEVLLPSDPEKLLSNSMNQICSFSSSSASVTAESTKVIDVAINYPNSLDSVFGEMKLVLKNSKSSFPLTKEKQKILDLILHLFSHILLLKKKLTEQFPLQEKVSSLQNNLQFVQEELEKSQRTMELTTDDSLSLLKLNQFFLQLMDVSSKASMAANNLQIIADLVWKAMPKVLSSASVLLAVNKSMLIPVAGSENEESFYLNNLGILDETNITDEYKLFWPSTSIDENNNIISNSNNPNNTLTINQLLHLQKYFQTPSAEQSTILLYIPGTKKVYGALLIFQSSSPPSEESAKKNSSSFLHTLEKVQDYFVSFTQQLIYSSLKFHYFHSFLQFYLKYLPLYEKEKEIHLQLQDTFSRLLKDKDSLDLSCNSLTVQFQELQEQFRIQSSEIKNLKNENLQIQEDSNNEQQNLVKEFYGKEKHYELELSKWEEKQQEYLNSKSSLIDLSLKFVYDDRCQPENVLTWLEEVASVRNSTLLSLKNSSNSFPSSGLQQQGGQPEYRLPEPFQSLNGLWAAVGEACRTGKSIRFESNTIESSLPNFSTVTGGKKSSTARNSSAVKGRSLLADPNENTKSFSVYDVLVIPNRALTNAEGSIKTLSTSSYCYIFTKPLGDKWHAGFTEDDLDLLELATNMTARILSKSVHEINHAEYLTLEKNYLVKSNQFNVFLRTINCSQELILKSFKNENDLIKELKSSAFQELFSSSKCNESLERGNPMSPVFTDIEVIRRKTSHNDNTRYFFKSNNTVLNNLIESVLTSSNGSTIKRDGQFMVMPIWLSKQQFYGIVIFEKKLRSPSNETPSTMEDMITSGKTSPSFIDVSQLQMNDNDEIVANILNTFLVSVLERFSCIKEAFFAVEDANNSLIAVQESKLSVDDRLTLELSSRMEYEESVKIGIDFLSMACSHRLTIGQLSDLLKKSLLSLTNSLDCYIILPYHNDLLTNELLLELDEFSSDFQNYFLNNNKAKGTSQGYGYYTFISDNPYPVYVNLEEGDMEYISLTNFKPVFLPPNSHYNRESNLHLQGWQSWAFRKNNLWNRGNLGIDADNIDNNQPNSDLQAITIPFRLSTENGGVASDLGSENLYFGNSTNNPATFSSRSTALVVLIRKNIPFSTVDYQCVSWLGQTLSYAFTLKSGKFQTKTRLQEFKNMQKEIINLRSNIHDFQLKESSLELFGLGFFEMRKHMENFFAVTTEQFTEVMNNNTNDSTIAESEITDFLNNTDKDYFFLCLKMIFYTSSVEECSENEWSDFILPMNTKSSANPLLSRSQSLDSLSEEPTFQQSQIFKTEFVVNSFGKLSLKFGTLPSRYQKKQLPGDHDKSAQFRKTRSPSSDFEENSSAGGVEYGIIKLERYINGNVPKKERGSTPFSYYLVTFPLPNDASLPASAPVNLNLSQQSLLLSLNPMKFQLLAIYFSFYNTWKQELTQSNKQIVRLQQEKSQEKELLNSNLSLITNEKEEITSKFNDLLQKEKDLQVALLQKQKLKYKSYDHFNSEISANVLQLWNSLYSYVTFDKHLTEIENLTAVDYFVPKLEQFLEKTMVKTGSGYNYWIGLLSDSNTSLVSGISWHSSSSSVALSNNLVSYFVNGFGENLMSSPMKLVMLIDDSVDKKERENLRSSHDEMVQIISSSSSSTVWEVSFVNQSTTGIPLRGKENHGVLLLIPSHFFLSEDSAHSSQNLLIYLSFDDNNGKQSFSKSIYRLYNYALFHVGNFISFFSQLFSYQSLLKLSQQEINVMKVMKTLNEKKYNQLLKGKAFYVFLHETLKKKTNSLQVTNSKLSSYRQKSIVLNQLIADWTELIKGLNGSSQFIVGGIKSLWARSCSTLLSVISGHCTVVNCGLVLSSMTMVNNNATNQKRRSSTTSFSSPFIEYLVKNISTPFPTKKKAFFNVDNVDDSFAHNDEDSSPGDNRYQDYLEYANAHLEVKNISDYGNKVFSLVSEIFEGKNSFVQRIYRISQGNKGGYVYLIPIKTAVETLGILHLQVEYLANRSPEVDSENTNFIPDADLISLIENNLVNFSELLAPLMVSSHSIDDLNLTNQQQIVSMKEKEKNHQQLYQDVQFSNHSLQILKRMDLVLSACFQEALITDDILSSIDGFTKKLSTELSSLVSSILNSPGQFQEHTQVQQGKVLLLINKELLSHVDEYWFYEQQSNPAGNPNREQLKENYHELMNKFIMKQQKSSAKTSVASSLTEYKYFEELTLAADSAKLNSSSAFLNNLVFGFLLITVLEEKRNLSSKENLAILRNDATQLPSSSSLVHQNSLPTSLQPLQTILKGVAQTITAMILSITKESIAKKKVTLSVETIQEMKFNHEKEKDKYSILMNDHSKLTAVLEEQKKWNALSIDTLQILTLSSSPQSATTSSTATVIGIEQKKDFYATILQQYLQDRKEAAAASLLLEANEGGKSNRKELKKKKAKDFIKINWKNQIYFIKFLENMLAKSLQLLGHDYCSNIVLINDVILSTTTTTNELIWIYGKQQQSLNAFNHFIPLGWNSLPENTKAVVINLVNSCVEKKKKSFIEIRQQMSSFHDPKEAIGGDHRGSILHLNTSTFQNQVVNLRIEVLPLLNSYTQDLIGVLQFIHLLPMEGANNAHDELNEVMSVDELDNFSASPNHPHPALVNQNKTNIYQDLGTLFSRLITHEFVSMIMISSYENSIAHNILLNQKQEHMSIQYRLSSILQKAWKMFSNFTTLLNGQFFLFMEGSRGSSEKNFIQEFIQLTTREYSTTSNQGNNLLQPLLNEIGIQISLQNGKLPSSEIMSPLNQSASQSTKQKKKNLLMAQAYIPLLSIDFEGTEEEKKGSSAVQYLEIDYLKNSDILSYENILAGSASSHLLAEFYQIMSSHAVEYLELFLSFIKSLFNSFYEKKNSSMENKQHSNYLNTELISQQQKVLLLNQEKMDLLNQLSQSRREKQKIQEISFETHEKYWNSVYEIFHSSSPSSSKALGSKSTINDSIIEWKYHLEELYSIGMAAQQDLVKYQQTQQNAAEMETKAHQDQNSKKGIPMKKNPITIYYEEYYKLLLQLLNQKMIKLFISSNYPSLKKGTGKNHQQKIFKYHLSIITPLDDEEESLSNNDSFRAQMVDHNKDVQELTIINFHSLNRMKSGNIAKESHSEAIRQSLVEKAFEINSVLFEERYSIHSSEDGQGAAIVDPMISMTDLIGINDPDFHYLLHSSNNSENDAFAQLEITVMTIGIKYSSENKGGNVSKTKRSASSSSRVSNAVIRIVFLHNKRFSPKEIFSLSAEDRRMPRLHTSLQQPPHIHNETDGNDVEQFLQQSSSQAYVAYEQELLFSYFQNIFVFYFVYSEMILSMIIPSLLVNQQWNREKQSHLLTDLQQLDPLKQLCLRYQKIFKIIYKESNKFLDPPMISPENGLMPKAIHPANLTPLAASQDTCMKLLSQSSNLFPCDGVALLLKDTTTDPITYQVMYIGDAMTWPGIEQNSFGIVTSHMQNNNSALHNVRASLIESIILSRKSVILENAPKDERYVSKIDGIMSLDTSLLLIPMKGRNGSIVGVLSFARVKESSSNKSEVAKKKKPSNNGNFTEEEMVLGELMSSYGSLALYWCQGLGSLHHQLHKTMNKLEKLEKIVQKNSM